MYKLVESLSRFSLLIVMLLLPILIIGALRTRGGSAQISDWLPKHKSTRQVYDNYLRLFGEDRFVLVSWDGCVLGDPRLSSFQNELIEQDREREETWFAKVTTTESVLEHMMDEPLKLSQKTAQQRLQGLLLGENGVACLLIEFTTAGIANSSTAIESIYQIGETQEGIAPNQIRMVGPVFEEFAIEQASNHALRYLVPPSTLAAVLVAILALRQWQASLVVFSLAGLAQLMALAAIYYTGSRLSAVMIVMPTLVFMLTLSSCVHLVNYFREVPITEPHRGVQALGLGLKPTLLATLTTMAGMASLVVSDLAPVRSFGLYSASTLGIGTMVLLLLFPAVVQLLLRNANDVDKSGSSHGQSTENTEWLGGASWIVNHAGKIVVGAILSLSLCLLGVWGLKPSTRFDQMFAASNPAITSLRWAEKNLGPIVSVEVMLTFPDTDQDLLQQIRWISAIESSMRQSPDVGVTLSAAQFLPAVKDSGGFRGQVARIAFAQRLKESLSDLAEQKWFAKDSREQNVWRITCKVNTLEEDYRIVTSRLRSLADAAVAKFASEASPPERIDITGTAVVAYESQRLLIGDLGSSFAMAFVLITPIMMLVTRSVVCGLIAMLPNVLPVVMVFGGLGLGGFPIDVAGILTASVALGIAVDDTLHYLCWFRRGQALGYPAIISIQFAYRHCARAMIETTLICCSAMVPLLFSGFVPTAKFSGLMIAMLLLAITADLLLLPALLLITDRWNTRGR